MSKYVWTEDMGEISGFGGGYEDACRQMVRQGLDWWDAHPEAHPAFQGFKGVFGLVTEENDDAKALSAAMCDAIPGGGPTGAMFQATMMAVLWIHQHGWEAYEAEMRKARTERDAERS